MSRFFNLSSGSNEQQPTCDYSEQVDSVDEDEHSNEELMVQVQDEQAVDVDEGTLTSNNGEITGISLPPCWNMRVWSNKKKQYPWLISEMFDH